MKLTVSKEAAKYIENHLNHPNQKLLLSYDDGVGPFSKVGVCSLDTAFQIIAVSKELPTPDYDAKLESNIGEFEYKAYSKAYLGENLRLDLNEKYKTLSLSSEEETLDSSIVLLDLTGNTEEFV
ncbi:iron-sulfur cluster biosynthesis family protein [Paucilactobacillus suebicus]|nr:iron-sulfur cluster biosynthesis family protein [Paucilactobacillus suebicus]